MLPKHEVKDIEELLVSQLEEDEKIADVDISRLTAPGQNYGSIMLSIIVTLENVKTTKKRTLNTVGKIIPDSLRCREAFYTQTTFTLEYNFYARTSKVMDDFLKRHNVKRGADFLAPFVAGRLNLNRGPIVDDDAIIILQNLRESGYSTGNKSVGLDLESSKVVLDSLAKFHATGLGLKMLEPAAFDEYIKPCFFRYVVDKELHNLVRTNIAHYFKQNGFTQQELEKIDRTFVHCHENKISDVWGTLIHYDSWTNNLLIKEENGKPTHCVLIDFQVPDYGTPLDDVSFFLFTSVRNLLDDDKTFDDLLTYYYNKLLENLRDVGVDVSLFTRESFDEELRLAIKGYQYHHTIWMLHPLMYEKMTSIDDLYNNEDEIPDWTKEHIQKVVNISRLCLERDYI